MSYRLRLEWRNGRVEDLAAEGGQSVLEAAEAGGVELPFGCRHGACATCAARLRSGTVDHRRSPRALKERHLDEGYVLTCVGVPRTDCRLEVGAAVSRDLVENPWK